MSKPENLSINNYNYNLPDDRIAKYPLQNRDESKLLTYINGTIEQTAFKNISNLIPENSLLVSNNTKVIRARLAFKKDTGANIEVFCLEPFNPADYNLAFTSIKSCEWACIIGNNKKWKHGQLSKRIEINGNTTELKIEKTKTLPTSQVVRFTWDHEAVTFGDILESTGNVPIPPYLNREAEADDVTRYQTIYSKHKGSVAAPTAGLHFTNTIFDSLSTKNISRHEVTLHVGAGTFKPVKDENVADHEMHTEHFYIDKNILPPLIKNLGNITAVGTTTVRTLESIYWLGVKLLQQNGKLENPEIEQWEAYELKTKVSVKKVLDNLHEWILNQPSERISVKTSIMIAPGYSFKLIDRLITNFHQPKSTLLLLIAAFIGEDWRKVYDFALKNNFRFLSYGDSCFLSKKKEQ